MLGKSIVIYSTTTRYGNLRGSVDYFRVVKAGRESYIAPPTTLDTRLNGAVTHGALGGAKLFTWPWFLCLTDV